MDLPWFMFSPSPVSFLQYGALIWIMWNFFSNSVKYNKLPRLNSLLDAVFVVGFFVCLTDAMWVSMCLLRWLPLYPGDLWLLLFALGRDLCASALFGLMIWDHFRSGKLDLMNSSFIWLGICLTAQALWFAFSPSPAFTDYTYAFRHGYDLPVILGSWLLSHWIMRIPLWFAILKTRSQI